VAVPVQPGGQRKETQRGHDIYDPRYILLAGNPVFTKWVNEEYFLFRVQ
jgi:hypothetical protein